MSSENSINFCPNCGTKTIPKAKFCIECGYEFALLHNKSIEQSSETEQTNNTDNTTQNKVQMDNNEITSIDNETIKPPEQDNIQNEETRKENKTINNQNNFDIIRPNINNKTPKKHIKKDFNILNQVQVPSNKKTEKQINIQQSKYECPSCNQQMQTSQKSGFLSKSTYHTCNNCSLTFKENNEYLILDNEPEFTRFRSKLHQKRYAHNQWKEILNGNYTPEEVSQITSWIFEDATSIQCPACTHELAKYKTNGFVSHYLICPYCNLILEERKNSQYTLFNSTENYSPLWRYENQSLSIHELRELFANESPEEKQQREIAVKEHEKRFQEHENEIRQQQTDFALFTSSLENGEPMLTPPTDSIIVLKKNEKAIHKVFNVSLLEPRAVRTSSGGYGGTSVRITKGVTLHSGRTASKSESHDEIKVIDDGDLLITNQRLIFLGKNRTINIDLKKIISITSEKDMIQIQRSNKQKPEYFTNIKSTAQVNIEGREYSMDMDGNMIKKLIIGLV